MRPCVGPSKDVGRFITLSNENYDESLHSEKKNKIGNILVIIGGGKWRKGSSQDVLTFKRPIRLDDPIIYDIFSLMLVSNQVTNPS